MTICQKIALGGGFKERMKAWLEGTEFFSSRGYVGMRSGRVDNVELGDFFGDDS